MSRCIQTVFNGVTLEDHELVFQPTDRDGITIADVDSEYDPDLGSFVVVRVDGVGDAYFYQFEGNLPPIVVTYFTQKNTPWKLAKENSIWEITMYENGAYEPVTFPALVVYGRFESIRNPYILSPFRSVSVRDLDIVSGRLLCEGVFSNE